MAMECFVQPDRVAMLIESQREVVNFLMSPATHGGMPVERIDTHSAMVFLAGARALKLKRAVRFDYLDFSTRERRRAACEAELRINRRAAPAIYRGLVAITRESDSTLALNGAGSPVDWLVDMNRFDQAALLDRLSEQGALDLSLMRPLASAIARFHAEAEGRNDHGGYAGMAWVIEGNADGFATEGRGMLNPKQCAELTNLARRELGRRRRLLDARRNAGFVRQCHGDLHLRNIVLLDGWPTLFDAIEFSDEIACVDVVYDLAFLLMDLWRRNLRSHANAVLNAYLAETADFAGLALLPLFLSCRAAVRAKTSATAARVQEDPRRRRELEEMARGYLAMAMELLRPAAPQLIAIGGLSGSGKSTVARALAPSIGGVPGAVVLRSDEIRKRLCGVSALDRLGPDGYTGEVTTRVYRTLAEHARLALIAGHSVIVDAVFARPADRIAIEALALSADVPLSGIWLDAPATVLESRVARRQRDASDADVAIVRQQLATDVGPMTWSRVDAALPLDVVVAAIQESGPRWVRLVSERQQRQLLSA
jgi:aminoglycoside phosphotransferase family enzyme/predicted kinase